MSKVVNLREWRLKDNRIVYYRAGKQVGTFGFLDTVDKHGKDQTDLLVFGKPVDEQDFERSIEHFIENVGDDVITQSLYKSCRGCFNLFFHESLDDEHGVCSKCRRKVEGFKKSLSVSDMGESLVGGFGSGRFISSHNFDDRLEIGSFRCSLVRVIASCSDDYTIASLFSDKPRVGKIEKNSDSMFTAVYNKQGYPPLPDGLILLFYDIFLAVTNSEIDRLENESA